ncbi:class B sortase [Clostridium sp. MSJ-4]|uniref:Class B sortase n=1 Tax=Clostridium simiarum TaxID=2841506 RepID=A0ABS6F524_9CLOT|nr:class B sortase [Clostridium simiarum]MBU5592642.1 class B sortase [Clostridium simiarum]
MAGIVLFGILLVHSNTEYLQGDVVYEQVKSALRHESTEINKSAESADVTASKMSAKMDFAPLKKINDGVVGWILAEGSVIDYPIVLGEDNEYYLSHLFNHEENKLGSIFMDYRNNGNFSDKNTIIYGHNMKNGSMFSSLTKYKDQSYYDSFPTMVLYTPNGDFIIEFFAGIIVDGNYEFLRFKFTNDMDFQDYINELKEKSTFESNTIVKSDDRIVTLCTCSYEFNNARYALYGKLTPISLEPKGDQVQ